MGAGEPEIPQRNPRATGEEGGGEHLCPQPEQLCFSLGLILPFLPKIDGDFCDLKTGWNHLS